MINLFFANDFYMFFQYLQTDCVGPPATSPPPFYYDQYNYNPNGNGLEKNQDFDAYEDIYYAADCPDDEPKCRNCALVFSCSANNGF